MTNYTIKLFFADWCGHCQRFKPEWEKFKEYIKSNQLADDKGKPVTIDTIDFPDNDEGSKMEMETEQVQGFPTIIIYKDNSERKIYEDKRDFDSLLKYLNIKKRDTKQVQTGGQNNYYNKYLKYKSKYLTTKNAF
ncbi:thioredoxin [Catovirus CTV1]|uniref:Thioredoxin n=1 Tax=Catovirus CTV1 TaxID=1977631 RepID=A0A1V0SAT2_9VIRU|nr:thioredoxin [Catovirus CTV1]